MQGFVQQGFVPQGGSFQPQGGFQPQVLGHVLKVNGSLTPGQALKSLNNDYYAQLNDNGFFFVYQHNQQNTLWTSNNNKQGQGPFRLTQQDDGNLVIYDRNNQPLWASDTWNKGAKGHYLRLGDDGNLNLFDGNNQITWKTEIKQQGGGGGFVPQVQVIGHVLKVNGTIVANQALKSLSNDYYAQLNDNGFFYVYHQTPQNTLWTSNNNKNGQGPYRITQQDDGNLVIYDRNNQPLWASDTWNKGAKGHYLRLGDDGNLNLFDGNNQITWKTEIKHQGGGGGGSGSFDPNHPSSKSIGDSLRANFTLNEGQFLKAPSYSYYLTLHNNGQAALYNSDHIHSKNAIWTSNNNKQGQGPFRLTQQDDGNLVIYDRNNQALWASDTWNKGAKGHTLKVQDDGNLVLYDGNNQPTWSTNTYRS